MKHNKFFGLFVICTFLFSSSALAAYCPDPDIIRNVVNTMGIQVIVDNGSDNYHFILTNNFDGRAPSVLKISLYANNKDEAINVIQQSLPSLKDPQMIDPKDSGASNWICSYSITPPKDGEEHNLSAIVEL